MTSTKNDVFYSPNKLQTIAEKILDISSQEDVKEAEVSVSAADGLEITVRENVCESVENQQKQSLAITLYDNGRKGSATTSDFSDEALKKTVKAAKIIAAHGESDKYAGLIKKSYLCDEFKELGLDNPWPVETEQLIDLAKQVESVGLSKATAKQQSDGVTISKSRGSRAYATTDGFNQAYCATQNSISSIMIASDTSGKMQKGYYYSSNRDPELLESADHIGAMAATRTEQKLGAKKISTQRLPIVFSSRVAPGLIGHLLSALSGKSQYEKTSFLNDSLGKKILPSFVSISEKPHIIGGLASTNYDSEGVTTYNKEIVTNGEIAHYILDGYSARKLDMEPTGNSGGVTNIRINHNDQSLAQMISPISKGLLVTELMGFGVNNVTGNYSRGATGFLIDNGEISHPVEEVTIAGNLLEMLADIVAISNDAETNNSVQIGSILIKEMTVAGN